MGCDIHAYAERKTEAGWERLLIPVPDDRDYISFAKLAGVRNGFGFAGVDTGNPLVPISEPRGLPNDTSIHDSPDDADYDDPLHVWLGDHSFSWVLLSELVALDWNEIVVKRGIVNSEEAEFVRKYNVQPSEWCGGTSDMTGKERVQWTMPLRTACRVLPQMLLALLPHCNGRPETVRIVFGFDN